MNPVRTVLLFMPRSSEWSLLFRLPNQNFICILYLPCACYMPHPSNPPWSDNRNNMWWRAQILKLLIMQLSHFIDLWKVYVEWHCFVFLSNSFHQIIIMQMAWWYITLFFLLRSCEQLCYFIERKLIFLHMRYWQIFTNRMSRFWINAVVFDFV
jgi:hypothetical protein